MGRRFRQDDPGTWHHVTNRGVAKRPMFERQEEMRYFLSRLAREVRAGRIEIHAFCLMTTHFHLLVRSPSGQLSEALRRAQSEYSRQFNRQHRRDGALIRGRFQSRLVESEEYRRAVVRYIDVNPVRARMVTAPHRYEFGSARHYAARRGPPWLRRAEVEDLARRISGRREYDLRAYRDSYSYEDTPELAESCALVEARMTARATRMLEGRLWDSAPADVRSWLAWKIRLADGRRPPIPHSTPEALDRALQSERSHNGMWFAVDGSRIWRGEDLCRIAGLRELCGRSWAEIAVRMAIPLARVRRLYRVQLRLLREQPDFTARCAALYGTLLNHK